MEAIRRDSGKDVVLLAMDSLHKFDDQIDSVFSMVSELSQCSSNDNRDAETVSSKDPRFFFLGSSLGNKQLQKRSSGPNRDVEVFTVSLG